MAKTANVDELLSGIDIRIESYTHPGPGEELVREFIEARDQGDEIAKGTLAEYVKQKYYPGEQVVVVPNLSNVHFEGFDIEGVDFTGCNLSGCSFQMISLNNCKFNDTDLSLVSFYNERTNIDKNLEHTFPFGTYNNYHILDMVLTDKYHSTLCLEILPYVLFVLM